MTEEEQQRRECIGHIESLYPPDDSEIGEELFKQALLNRWRDLPTPILRELSNLNLQREHGR